MLRDAAVDLIMKRLGNSTDLTLQQDIINEMVLAQETVLEGDILSPWFLVTEESAAVTAVAEERVALPADFILPWEHGFLFRYDVALDDPYIEMQREDWDEIKEGLNFSGTPTHYDIAGAYILMRPLSDEIYPLRMRYVGRGLDLSGVYGDANNIENVWLQHAADWLIGEVGYIIADQYLQQVPAKVKSFQLQAARGRTRVYNLNVAMEETMKVRIRGG